MQQQNDKQPEQKKVLTADEIDFVNRDLEEKYQELMRTSSLLESEKAKWKATFDEFDDFYNNAPCGYDTIDENGLIIKINQTFLNWLGYKREEVVNRINVIDLLSEKSTMLFYKYMPILRDKGHVEQVEVEYVRKDGTLLQALVSSRAIFDDKDTFKFVTTTVWDITARKKMEDEMLKVNRHLRAVKERFEEKNVLAQKLNDELLLLKKEQSDFYAKSEISLGLPLEKAANLCITALANTTPGTDLYRYLTQIQDTVKGVNSYLNGQRMQQRLTTDKAAPLRLAQFNLSELLINIVNRLDELAGKKKVNINCEIFEEIQIKSDKQFLSQVIDTLLSALIKLSLPDKEIPLRLIRKVNEYVIELEIAGMTISRAEIAELFDKNKVQEAELGKEAPLVPDSKLVNSLVESLGFDLSVSPVNHKGTLIRLVMPAAKVSA